jgi:hypothetical protein
MGVADVDRSVDSLSMEPFGESMKQIQACCVTVVLFLPRF